MKHIALLILCSQLWCCNTTETTTTTTDAKGVVTVTVVKQKSVDQNAVALGGAIAGSLVDSNRGK
jgi:hypothetical protein